MNDYSDTISKVSLQNLIKALSYPEQKYLLSNSQQKGNFCAKQIKDI